MNSLAVSLGIFACICGGVLLGLCLRRVLPHHYLGDDCKGVVSQSTGLVGTMTALLLGLLIASAKNSYDLKNSVISEMSAKAIFLDRILANYGPETREARELLRRTVAETIDRMWPSDEAQAARLDVTAVGEGMIAKVEGLSPQNDAQRALKTQALEAMTDLAKLRWLLFTQPETAVSMTFLIVVAFWLTLIFIGFSLFAPVNPPAISALLLCALSVASAFFLIMELDRPFDGLIQISSVPMRNALGHLGK